MANGVENDSDARSCSACQWATSANTECEDKCDAIADKDREKCKKMSPGPEQGECYQAVEDQRGACYKDCKNKK